MPNLSFASFPDCCQKLLRQLEKEGRQGSRNCEKGHAVSLDYARSLQTSTSKPEGGPASEPSAA